jgi:hypothetical protein
MCRAPAATRVPARPRDRPRLLDIIDAYELNPASEEIGWMTDRLLVTFIATAVEVRMRRSASPKRGSKE